MVLQREQQNVLDISALRISLKDEILCQCLQTNILLRLSLHPSSFFSALPQEREEKKQLLTV